MEKVSRVEQTGLGTVFMCTHGGTRYGNAGCRRTYLSQRDLQVLYSISRAFFLNFAFTEVYLSLIPFHLGSHKPSARFDPSDPSGPEHARGWSAGLCGSSEKRGVAA